MPMRSINQYTCPIHGEVVHADAAPQGWFLLENDIYCPNAAHELADFLAANEDATMFDAIAAIQPAA